VKNKSHCKVFFADKLKASWRGKIAEPVVICFIETVQAVHWLLPVQLGTCKMCLQRKQLVKSHFMPAALYDYCREGVNSPIKVGDGVVYPTDRQTCDYLLCKDCEHIFSDGGECWIADKLAKWKKGSSERAFPLYSFLAERAPYYREGGTNIYFAAAAPEIRVDKLTHFALGIFWKASVHSWSRTEKESRIEFGSYRDAIRDWLRTGRNFPHHVYLIVNIATPSHAQVALTDPYEGTRPRGGWRNFLFHVPGVLFLLAIGKTVDAPTKALCICNNPGKPIAICDSLTKKFVQVLAREVQGSRITKAYSKYEAKLKR